MHGMLDIFGTKSLLCRAAADHVRRGQVSNEARTGFCAVRHHFRNRTNAHFLLSIDQDYWTARPSATYDFYATRRTKETPESAQKTSSGSSERGLGARRRWRRWRRWSSEAELHLIPDAAELQHKRVAAEKQRAATEPLQHRRAECERGGEGEPARAPGGGGHAKTRLTFFCLASVACLCAQTSSTKVWMRLTGTGGAH